MQRKIVRFVEEENLFYRDEKILVAVSGGVDSVVMLDLLCKMEVECGVAHCNFHLREEESDGDLEFVKNLAKAKNLAFYSVDFDTKKYAAENKISIEMAARDLRYNWFEQVREISGYKYVAVGHHADDVAETVLINLARGTGIHGLSGIKSKLGKIIRPLLPFPRKQLLEYAQAHSIHFREDRTNAETDYVRNKIRHQIMPVLEEINPAIRATMTENVQRFREVEQIYNRVIEQNRLHLVFTRENQLLISIPKLKELLAPVSHLYELLSLYGFHHRDIRNIAESINGISGKLFYSATHQLLRDREYFILSEITEENTKEYLISEDKEQLQAPLELTITLLDRTPGFQFPSDSKIACFDANQLQFPLKLRKWKEGDAFRPIGMKGKKKISDYFIDQKFSLQEKENTWLLLSGSKIVWVLGHRMDDRFKITDTTTKIYKINLI
ncbi:tRNA lysidine(34) synthetase TilS [Labilibaculum filiforme]|uniref:tRNA(Ile)-lysidine synthase n=1 Tax=Labilibaculum filiforme TaxID=1940526 RepID=A0A2N3HYV0_9BACT|nr:tRNA lysidine(34) synthetase TilS [Labilibaculum filiforme]PKQ63207.1 tRNA lysidine(34) synthetase TilS [Labilibaculum filiforme]